MRFRFVIDKIILTVREREIRLLFVPLKGQRTDQRLSRESHILVRLWPSRTVSIASIMVFFDKILERHLSFVEVAISADPGSNGGLTVQVSREDKKSMT